MEILHFGLVFSIFITTSVAWREIRLGPNNCHTKIYDIVKSKNDPRNYTGLILCNDLKVTLISDSRTEVAAAAMAVGVGAMNDFKDTPGLAHLMEHMLFAGTKKYPSENNFTRYISDHGGETNAFTGSTITSYHFKIDTQHFMGALDRFAQFFIHPLLNATIMEKEIKSIDSEFKMNMADDNRRIGQLELSLCPESHAYNHFITGNAESLHDIPKSKNISVHEKLLDFHEKWYSSNLMSLVVYSNESLDKIEGRIYDLFVKIKNKNASRIIYPFNMHPWGPIQLRRIIYVVPLSDIRLLKFTFRTPDVGDYYKSGPEIYAAFLIGHEGPRSLLSALKRKGLANSVETDYSDVAGIGFFTFQFELTDKVIEDIEKGVDEIATLVFEFINVMKTKGAKHWIYEENRRIADINFSFKGSEAPMTYTQYLSIVMNRVPLPDILIFGKQYSIWNDTLVNEFMSYLRADNMNIMIVNQAFEKKVDLTERWFGTRYRVERISERFTKKWRAPKNTNQTDLPPHNDFIPDNVPIFPLPRNTSKIPYIVRNTPLSRFWLKQDDRTPKLEVWFEIESTISANTPHNRNLLDMFVLLFVDSINERMYLAKKAGFDWSIKATNYGIFVQLTGFYDKMPTLVTEIVNQLIIFKIREDRLNITKEIYVRTLKNFETERLHMIADGLMQGFIREKHWIATELLNHTDNLVGANIEKLAAQLFSGTYIQGVIHGNCDEEKAKNLSEIIEAPFRSINRQQFPKKAMLRTIEPKAGENIIFEIDTKNHINSCCYVYFQYGNQTNSRDAVLDLYLQIIREPYFEQMRTKEQLGYVVHSTSRRLGNMNAVVLLVESEMHPEYLNYRIENFIHDSLINLIENMTDNEFKSHKDALIQSKLEPKDLNTITNDYWEEIRHRLDGYDFYRTDEEIKRVLNVSKKDLIDFYWETFGSDSARRKFSIHVISTSTNPARPKFEPAEIRNAKKMRDFAETRKYLEETRTKSCH